MAISPEDFVNQLDSISEYDGVPYGRVHMLFDEEENHGRECLIFKGYLALSDGFKNLFLETVGHLNSEINPEVTGPLSEFYALFLPRLAHAFQSLCAAERIAMRGYPLHGYTLLRNTFDNLVLASAALQKITDFYSIEGVVPGQKFHPAAAKSLRKKTELKVRDEMTGAKSGLSGTTIDELKKWDDLFDYETHGARLTLASGLGWMKGTDQLPVVPRFSERDFAMFMNRCCEVGWMTHRLLPLIQPPGNLFPQKWREKWRIVDDSFEVTVFSLTGQLGKSIGAAIVELVKAKFPFNETSTFPL
jgi:hypothetical protein